ncbi:MAG: conjugal transfer protein TrbD [Sedimenticola sp.]
MTSELHSVPIRRSLVRPRLVAGAERELFLFLGLICATMIFVSVSWPSALLGIALWMTGVYALRTMAKADPMMSKVYARHLRYQPFYPARSAPVTKETQKRTRACWR